MWQSFTVRVLQDTDLWMVATQLISAISVIIASGVVVWISGQKERKAKEKRIEYFLDVVLFLYSQMEACRIYITRRKLSFIEDVVVMELFSSCRKTVERLNSNPLEVTYDCPNPGITRNLLTLALNFDEVARNIDNFKPSFAQCWSPTANRALV